MQALLNTLQFGVCFLIFILPNLGSPNSYRPNSPAAGLRENSAKQTHAVSRTAQPSCPRKAKRRSHHRYEPQEYVATPSHARAELAHAIPFQWDTEWEVENATMMRGCVHNNLRDPAERIPGKPIVPINRATFLWLAGEVANPWRLGSLAVFFLAFLTCVSGDAPSGPLHGAEASLATASRTE